MTTVNQSDSPLSDLCLKIAVAFIFVSDALEFKRFESSHLSNCSDSFENDTSSLTCFDSLPFEVEIIADFVKEWDLYIVGVR